MGLIKNIRLRFHRYFLRKALNRRQHSPQNVNLEEATHVGILFDATELGNRKLALRFAESLRKSGKKVRKLGYFHSDQNDPNFTFWHFNRKQVDWALRPNTLEVQEFIDEPFDLLINIEPVTKTHSEYVAALSRAKLKVGPVAANTDSYDLMLEPSDRQNMEAFIRQIESLLGKTNTKHEAAKI